MGGARDSLRSQQGVTLVEVLIVVALMAILTGMLLGGSGMVAATRMRGAATLILTGVQLGITHANTTGLPTRMVFDLDGQRVTLEETRSRMLRQVDEDEDDPSAGADPATEAERAAREQAAEILEGPREAPPRFSALKAFGTDPDDDSLGRSLGRGIAISSVRTEHDPEARTEGRAYLYFWPGGGTEKAVIQLTRAGREEPLSIVVSALTGRAKIVQGAVDYEEPSEDVDFGERELEE
jgi:general secretion pathway protein H